MATDAERERWGEIIWKRFHPDSAARIEWADLETPEDGDYAKRDWRMMAEKTRAELIPDGSVVVDRARFERLRMLASWATAITPVSDDGEGYCPEEVRFFAAARVAMKPGDLDPLL